MQAHSEEKAKGCMLAGHLSCTGGTDSFLFVTCIPEQVWMVLVGL
jgi:hypothetical protein